ncbi:MAG: CBS domain-containing protein [Francisellaceae bacterium]|nr:CBS domain-containing protein [Francisellaceae bacterium]
MIKRYKLWLDKVKNKIKRKRVKTFAQLSAHLKTAHKNNLLTTDALQMIEGVLSVSKLQVSDIMVPRVKMAVIEQGQSYEEILKIVTKSTHSRFPVIAEKKDKDDVIGLVHAKDLLKLLTISSESERNKKFKELFNKDNLRLAIFVPESQQLDTLLKTFKKSRKHLAVVVDEYGGISGLITIEDILEEIVGEIEDEFDIAEEMFIKQLSKTKYQINALTLIDDFNEKFKSNFDSTHVDTMGGLITQKFGSVPAEGQSLTIGDFKFTVQKADARHILELTLELPRKQV